MELKLLEDFLCLSDTRNFSRAAEARNITQSTLSKRIRALEHWAGATLVDRSSYPVALTPEGAAMVPQARELVAGFQGMRSAIRAFARPSQNSVVFDTQHTLRVTFLPGWRREVEKITGPFTIEPTSASAAYAQTLRRFRNGETDLLLTYVHPAVQNGLDPEEFDSVGLGRERVVPVSAPDGDGRPMHGLDGGGVVRFLSYGTSSFFAQALVPLLKDRAPVMNVAATNAMSIGLLSLARVGCGMAWVPESLATEDLANGTLVPAGGPDWELQVGIRLYRNRRRSRAMVERIWSAAERMSVGETGTVIPHPRARNAISG